MPSIWKKYAYFWITLVLFLGSLAGHWVAGWFAFSEEQRSHDQPMETSIFFTEIIRDTLENWQSEFLQLMWQVSGLALLWHVGSPQSKESDERKEDKIDFILRSVSPGNAEDFLKKVEKKYPKK